MNANERKSVAKDYMIFICPQIPQILTDCFVFNQWKSVSSADRSKRPNHFSHFLPPINANRSQSVCHHRRFSTPLLCNRSGPCCFCCPWHWIPAIPAGMTKWGWMV